MWKMRSSVSGRAGVGVTLRNFVSQLGLEGELTKLTKESS